MNPLDFGLLADENISPEVVLALRGRGVDVTAAIEVGLGGLPDVALLGRAAAEKRVILTHDADFGLLAIRLGVPFFGVVFLRPGHIASSIVLEVIDTLRREGSSRASPAPPTCGTIVQVPDLGGVHHHDERRAA